jgi:prepilin-type N-terminal cleavage/methylation domain-containing protein
MTRALSQSRRSQQLQQNQGFTTIELLVVIGILTVLAGLVYVGMKYLGGSSKTTATHAALGNLQGMLADLDAATGLSKQPADWLWTDNGSTIIRRQAGSFPNYDFWKGPSNTGTAGWPANYALPAPGSVADDGLGFAVNQRNGSIAIVNTDLAMTMMASVPDNRSRLQSLPQNQQMIPAWKSGQVSLPNGNTDLKYVAGSHVTHLGKQYVASQSYSGGSTPPGGTGEWIDITGKQPPAPILLDAWNNPIIFVPATGLRVRLQADPSKEHIVISPEGEVNNTTAAPTIVRPGRPFFASAGPDGDFTLGDDNVYSFDK